MLPFTPRSTPENTAPGNEISVHTRLEPSTDHLGVEAIENPQAGWGYQLLELGPKILVERGVMAQVLAQAAWVHQQLEAHMSWDEIRAALTRGEFTPM